MQSRTEPQERLVSVARMGKTKNWAGVLPSIGFGNQIRALFSKAEDTGVRYLSDK